MEHEIVNVLEKIIGRLRLEEHETLDAPLTVEKILATTRLLGKNKVSRAHEVSVEFYLEFWEEMGEWGLWTLQ